MSQYPCRVVLVRPMIAANIGSVARVMRNFGLSDLRLVTPLADPVSEEARKLSTHGESILHEAKFAADLREAASGCVLVVGTSARVGGPFRRDSVGTPREIMPRLVEATNSGPVALVFGPEQNGLANDEVTRCHHLIHISTDETYPALNLAQSVAICLYELQMAATERTTPTPVRETASFELQERMFANLQQALTDLHFLWGENADALMHAFRHLIGRAQPSTKEVEMLLGLARQLAWFARSREQPVCVDSQKRPGDNAGG